MYRWSDLPRNFGHAATTSLGGSRAFNRRSAIRWLSRAISTCTAGTSGRAGRRPSGCVAPIATARAADRGRPAETVATADTNVRTGSTINGTSSACPSLCGTVVEASVSEMLSDGSRRSANRQDVGPYFQLIPVKGHPQSAPSTGVHVISVDAQQSSRSRSGPNSTTTRPKASIRSGSCARDTVRLLRQPLERLELIEQWD